MKRLFLFAALFVSINALADIDTLNEKILLQDSNGQFLYAFPDLAELNGDNATIMFTIETKTDTLTRLFATYKAQDCINKSGLAHFNSGTDSRDSVYAWNVKKKSTASLVAKYVCAYVFKVNI